MGPAGGRKNDHSFARGHVGGVLLSLIFFVVKTCFCFLLCYSYIYVLFLRGGAGVVYFLLSLNMFGGWWKFM